MMTNEEAWAYAASWGSYMTAGDPGACMYGFDHRFHVQSENHRAACIKWLEGCRANVRDNPERYEEDELEKLDQLEHRLRNAAIDT